MAVLYSIRDWNDNFEVAQSRKLVKALDWVALPTKHDGKSFRRLMLMPDGPEIYGAWVLIVQVAAKCPKRGILADADGPLDTADLAIKTGCRQELFEKALKVLSAERIGWILVGQWESNGRALPPHTDRTDIPTNQPDKKSENGAVGGRAGFLEVSWEAVESRIAALGVSEFRKATDAAKAQGCTPELAMKIVDVAQSQNYGPGAIVRRFGKANPALPLLEGWPPAKQTQAAAERSLEDVRALIIRDARARGASDKAINAALSAEGCDPL